jgi:hypothetical protein
VTDDESMSEHFFLTGEVPPPLPHTPTRRVVEYTVCFCRTGEHHDTERESYRPDLDRVRQGLNHYSPDGHLLRRTTETRTRTEVIT